MAKPENVAIERPWEHPHLADFRVEHRAKLWHGRHFSNIALGAVILYNQLLAELRGDTELLEQHRLLGRVWLEAIDQEFGDLSQWASDLPAFWSILENRGYVIEASTMAVVEQWIALLLQHSNGVFELVSAKKLIRELQLNLAP